MDIKYSNAFSSYSIACGIVFSFAGFFDTGEP